MSMAYGYNFYDSPLKKITYFDIDSRLFTDESLLMGVFLEREGKGT